MYSMDKYFTEEEEIIIEELESNMFSDPESDWRSNKKNYADSETSNNSDQPESDRPITFMHAE